MADPDSEIVVFAKRTAKDLKLPPGFITVMASAIQVGTSTTSNFPIKVSTEN